MKKVLFFILLLLLHPNTINAWESSIGLGYYGRLFNERDNLGTDTYDRLVVPNRSNGLALNTNFLIDFNSSFRTGLDLMFEYGWLKPQTTMIDSDSFQNWGLIISHDAQYINNDWNLSLKSGFIINGLISDYKDRIDIDTGFSFSLRTIVETFGRQRIFIEPQIIITPGVKGNKEIVVCPALILGLETFFHHKKVINKPVVVAAEPPKETTPVVIPESPTPVSIPVALTETKEEPEKPKKLMLKFNDNNLDSAESTEFLQNILNIHNKIPSTINVHHSKGENAKIKADALKKWFLDHGALEQEVIINEGLKGKEIKIEVNKKEE